MKIVEPSDPPSLTSRPQTRPLSQILESRVLQRLRSSANPQLASLSVQGRYCGFVEVAGVVPDAASKRQALLIAESISDVVDRIRVVPQAFPESAPEVEQSRATWHRIDAAASCTRLSLASR